MKDNLSHTSKPIGSYIGRMGVGQPITVMYIDDVDGAIHRKIDKEILEILKEVERIPKVKNPKCDIHTGQNNDWRSKGRRFRGYSNNTGGLNE